MPVEPPQHLNGSNNSGGFEPVVHQEMEVRTTGLIKFFLHLIHVAKV